LPIGIARIDSEDGSTDYITCIPQERVFTGSLPSEAIVGVLLRPLTEGERIDVGNFAANSVFIDLMQGLISHRGPSSNDLVSEARQLGEGVLYVIDRRTRTPATEVPEQDVFGEFDVQDGRILAGSYRPNSKHYLYSDDGFFQLGSELEDCLLQALAAIPGPDEESEMNVPPS